MDPKNTKAKTDSKPAESTAATATETTSAPAAPALTTPELKALGAAFLSAQEAEALAEEKYQATREAKSKTVKAIVEALGHKGPFSIGGKLWSASVSKKTGFHGMRQESGPRAEL